MSDRMTAFDGSTSVSGRGPSDDPTPPPDVDAWNRALADAGLDPSRASGALPAAALAGTAGAATMGGSSPLPAGLNLGGLGRVAAGLLGSSAAAPLTAAAALLWPSRLGDGTLTALGQPPGGMDAEGRSSAAGDVVPVGAGVVSGEQVSPMTGTGPVWDGTVSTPAAAPSPAQPGYTPLSDAAKQALGRPETLPADPDAGTPQANVTHPAPVLPNTLVTTPTLLDLPDVWAMSQKTSRPYSATQDAQDWARAQRLGYARAEYDDLARDPDHAGQINDASQWERGSLLEAEDRGLIPGKQKRGPKGSDGEDGTGQYWDVKSFDSNYPPSKGGFTPARAARTIERELCAERAPGKYNNVLVETRWMKPADVQALEREMQARPNWKGRVEVLK